MKRANGTTGPKDQACATLSSAGLAFLFTLASPAPSALAQQAAGAIGSVSAAPENEAPLASEEQNLAKQLANPVAWLISAPFHFNYDQGINPLNTGKPFTLNVQPVVPIALNPDWNLISRTIVPINWSDDLVVGSGRIFGSGDIVQSLFLSPAKPLNEIIWGVGPVGLLPTGSSDIYSADQWGAGPTAVVLDQTGPWTVGVPANHIWSFAKTGYPSPNVNATFSRLEGLGDRPTAREPRRRRALLRRQSGRRGRAGAPSSR